MTTWWNDHNNRPHDPLSVEAVALLEDVEAAFRAQDPPSWPFPEDGARDEDYSVSADPGEVPDDHPPVPGLGAGPRGPRLGHRGAGADGEEDWRITLTPRRQGALLVHLQGAAWLFDNGRAPMVEVAVADPPNPIADIPACACDACDSGSDVLIEDLDKEIFSVVDGSFLIRTEGENTATASSFGGGGWTSVDATRAIDTQGAPWAENWVPRTPISLDPADLPPWPPPGFDDLPEDWPADPTR
ncbi:DUF6226 family protein [Corynebacterium suedekumii]|nr:DUF6226 family protein [Corynebacterium suedekumii]